MITNVIITQPYKYHKLDADIATKMTLTKEDAVKYYTQMKVIRTMETAAGNLYKEKAIRGFCHLYSGQVSHNDWTLPFSVYCFYLILLIVVLHLCCYDQV